MHHLHRNRLIRGDVEIIVHREVGTKRLQPVALEVDSIDKDESCQAVDGIWSNEVGNFVVSLLRDPLVDDRSRSIAVTPDNRKITITDPLKP